MDKCKGFWNMCGCPQCRKRDKELERTLEKGTPEQKQKMIAEAEAALGVPLGMRH